MNCIPNCPDCNGLGFVRDDAEFGEPNFGKLFPCPNKPAEMLFDFAKCGIQPNDKAGWDDLSQNAAVISMRKAVEHVMARGYGFVFLWSSEPGVAKTVALKIAVRQSLEKKIAACYIRMSDILENLRSVYGDNKQFVDLRDNAVSALAKWTTIPVLAIDEFEKARASEFEAEKKFALLDKRYELNIENQAGITLIASNQDPRTIENSYLRSRIFDGDSTVLEVVGADARPVQKRTPAPAPVVAKVKEQTVYGPPSDEVRARIKAAGAK